MKRILGLMVLCAVLLLASGCGGKEETQISLGFAQVGAESDWRAAHTASIKQAARESGIALYFADAQQSQEQEIAALRTFIAKRVQVIAFVPVVESGWEEVLAEAQKARIPVIVVDRDVDCDPSLYAAKIGTDPYMEGQQALGWLDSYLTASGKQPKSGAAFRVVALAGNAGASATEKRQQGFLDALREARQTYDLVAVKNADFLRQKGREAMEDLLREGVSFDVLFAQNDDMALGAIDAMERANLRPGQDVTVLSVDGGRAIFEAMQAGKANCTIECNPLQGPLLMEAVQKIARGEAVEKRIDLASRVYPAETAAAEIDGRKY